MGAGGSVVGSTQDTPQVGRAIGMLRESALQWLRFIHSDYYVGQELRNRGVNPEKYDLNQSSALFVKAVCPKTS